MDEISVRYDNEESGMANEYMAFAIGSEIYGLKIEYISEILNMQTITVVPEVPAYIKGIINMRGKILPVMDVRLRFNKEPMEYNDRTCIIVAMINNTMVGLIVDTVREVMEILPDEITDTESAAKEMHNRYIKAVGKTEAGVVLLLDLDRLVSD
ncbi:MAG: chemotaxis protein CheW [Oscillospiraceae bacterium]|jgi:purine-binding chemotaxis protein CheW|nr:chemotaxis protein CheW [Oscillospiraceae bacterium]